MSALRFHAGRFIDESVAMPRALDLTELDEVVGGLRLDAASLSRFGLEGLSLAPNPGLNVLLHGTVTAGTAPPSFPQAALPGPQQLPALPPTLSQLAGATPSGAHVQHDDDDDDDDDDDFDPSELLGAAKAIAASFGGGDGDDGDDD